jgi:hypothetical protein
MTLRHKRGLCATRCKRNRGGQAHSPTAHHDCVHAVLSYAGVLL